MTTDVQQSGERVLALTDFIHDFKQNLLSAVQAQNPAIFAGDPDEFLDMEMDVLSRPPFPPQRNVVQAMYRLLVEHDQPAGVINAEMGTGKTLMGIATAVLLHRAGYTRSLVIAPPHLVYKWRREIRMTVPGARVWILNGPDTLRKLLQLRCMRERPTQPEFFILGRVRMRMGFNWRPVFVTRHTIIGEGFERQRVRLAACPDCGAYIKDADGEWLSPDRAKSYLDESRRQCEQCHSPLWSLVGEKIEGERLHSMVHKALCRLPTIGDKTAQRLIDQVGVDPLSAMLEDNVYEFINMFDQNGDLLFSDRQAARMERAMANTEICFGQGGYQPTEFIKRYLPQGYFGLLIVDEGHEYKNEGSAQGQAMGVLARKASKTLLLTGTLMGGYADDLFYLLYRLNPGMMIEDGYRYSGRRSLGPACMAFMRDHGVLKDVYRERDQKSHRTAKGTKMTHRTVKAPGFGPKGIMRYVLPITAFLKLSEIGGKVLPPYTENFQGVAMREDQERCYRDLAGSLQAILRQALRKGDKTLLGVVLNVLLAWPDCAFRDELVKHPRTRQQLAYVPAIVNELEPLPKERELIDLCRTEVAQGRRVLTYTVYTGTRDTTVRLKSLLEQAGLRVSVLRASVPAEQREDWLMEQVDRGVDVLLSNPELVKTGLDLLDFPTIVFMQSGYNVYTLMQAAKRAWRIGQKLACKVIFLGYQGTAQMTCLELMAKKIAVAQSTSGNMPESGLDILNDTGDSIEVALAKQLLSSAVLPLQSDEDDPHQDDLFGEPIYRITRAQLIQDGDLVDVSTTAREAGYRVDVAVSRAVWEDCVAWSAEDDARQTSQDEAGRLWDLLWMSRLAAKGSGTKPFRLLRIARDGQSRSPQEIELQLVVGPGDNGEPVVTILLPGED